MNEFIIMIIDRFTSTPIYSRTIETSKQNEIKIYSTDDEIILSALLNSIQTIMTQVKIGEIRVIETEDHHILVETNEDYIVAALGEFQNIMFIQEIMRFILNYTGIINIEAKTTGLIDINEELSAELDDIIIEILMMYSILNVKVEIFKKQGILGYIPLSHSFGKELEMKLIQKYSGMKDKHQLVNHYFIDYFPENNSYVFSVNYAIGKKAFLFAFQFINVRLNNILSYKHVLIQDALEFIYGINSQSKLTESEIKTKIAQFNHLLRKNIKIYKPSEKMLFGIDILLSSMPNEILFSVSTLLAGKPLAVLGNEEISKPVINLLSYITNITDVNLFEKINIPSRISGITEQERTQYEEMGYAILDVEKKKLDGAVKLKYFEKKKKLLEIKDISCKEKMNMLRGEIVELWNYIEELVSSLNQGDDLNELLKAIDDKDFKNIIINMVENINPHFLNKFNTNYAIDKINW